MYPLSPLPVDIQQAPSFRAFLNDLEMLGVKFVSDGGAAYAVIAARSNPRWWLLPLDNRRAAVAGLEMLHAGSLAAKAFKIGARFMAQFGSRRLLGQRQIRLCGAPDLAGSFDSRDLQFAYFTGTEGPHRKTALQIMDTDGGIQGYAKMSRKAHIRPYIRHEAEMLVRVADLDLPSADVPQVLAIRDSSDLTLLVTDSSNFTDGTSPWKPAAAHLRWLNDLRVRTGQVGAESLLGELVQQLTAVENLAGIDWRNRINRALTTLHPVAGEIQLCLVHGDFTPWNCFVQSDRLYVFDWEYANPAWPVGFDLSHFLLSTIRQDQKFRRLPQVLATLARMQFDYDDDAARRALLLSLICHALFYLRRLAEARSTLADWSEGPVRGTLIDVLLDSYQTTDFKGGKARRCRDSG